MVSLDTQNVTTTVLGQAHGLDLEQLKSEYADKISNIVQQLVASKTQPGKWTEWLALPENEGLYQEINQYTASVKGNFSDLLILGIGGSSLGGYALLKGLLHPHWNLLPAEKRNGFPRFHFVDNVDADTLHGLLDVLDPKTTLVNVITKSGTTAETMSAFLWTVDWFTKAFKNTSEKISSHVVVTTDPTKGTLRSLAQEEGFQSFEIGPDVGGRFSVFSAVGLLPAALCGIDINALRKGLLEIQPLLQNPDINQNPAALNALIQYESYQRGKPLSVFMPYSARLAPVSDWYVQLWAESLGKKTDLQGRQVFVGPTPVRAVGVTDQHSQVQLFNEGPFDKIFTFVTVETADHPEVTIPAVFANQTELSYLHEKRFETLMNAEFVSTRASLTRNQRPNVTLALPRVDAPSLAKLLYLLEVQTAIAGGLFEVDPFDQPGVELAKKYTYALMGRQGYEQLMSEAQGQILTSATV